MEAVYSNDMLLPECEGYTFSDTWYNFKIPYYYDYAEQDNIVSGSKNHGVAVASLIGGNSSDVTGTAPDSQLALFKIADAKGTIDSATVLKALEDAYKLDVDAVNLSIGDPSGFSSIYSGSIQTLNFEQVFDNFKAKGVSVFVSSGNSSNSGSYYHQGYKKYLPLTETSDYATVSSFASQKNVVAVGALKQNRANVNETPT